MGVLLILIGLVLIVAAYRNTVATFAGHLQEDIGGDFLKWVAALVLIGVIGYIPGLTTISRLFLALVVLVVVLKRGSGLFAQFNQAFTSTPQAEQAQPASSALPDPTLNIKIGSGGSGGLGGAISGALGGNIGGAVGGAASTAATGGLI